MKNIHVLPTDKPSKIIKSQDNDFILLNTNVPNWFEINLNTTKQNIYITSDEEIKEDWCYRDSGIVFKMTKELLEYYKSIEHTDTHKRYKIILTTDQDLIKDGVQAIDDEFLEWFVKNPSCEWVEVEDVYKKFLNGDKRSVSDFRNKYKIIIPKEEPKQETLEEVSERFSKQFLNNGDNSEFEAQAALLGVNFGAKWQQERMYSNEEVIQLLIKFNQEIQEVEDVRIWFEQFKKK